MNRTVTNAIRFLLDECLPPVIRDNKYFMYPFFWYAFKGKNVRKMMEFKSYINTMSNVEYEELYRTYESMGNDRPTDLNNASINYILKSIPEDCKKVIDVGCGRGYFLSKLAEKGYEAWGCDVFDSVEVPGTKYVRGNIEHLPFEDEEFDVVICSHTLEHVKNISKAIEELKRITRKRLIVTVPKQRHFYYTLDLHLHFFPYEALLVDTINMKKYECWNKRGDWVYIGDK